MWVGTGILSINLTRTFQYFRVFFFILIRTTTRNIGLQTKVTVNIKKKMEKNVFTLYWCFHFTYSPFKIIFNSVTSMYVCMLKYAYQFAKKMIMIMIMKIQPLDKLSTANFIHVQQELYAPKYYVKPFLAYTFLIQLNGHMWHYM